MLHKGSRIREHGGGFRETNFSDCGRQCIKTRETSVLIKSTARYSGKIKA